MSHLPAFCDVCSRVCLVALPKRAHVMPSCPTCAGDLRAIPSRSYSAAEVALFDELSGTVSDGLAPIDAQRLGAEAAKILWSGSFGDGLNALASRWPGLLPLQTVIGNNIGAQRRILQMLQTIFDALATSRRSEVILAAGPRSERSAPDLGSRLASRH